MAAITDSALLTQLVHGDNGYWYHFGTAQPSPIQWYLAILALSHCLCPQCYAFRNGGRDLGRSVRRMASGMEHHAL